MYVLRRLFAIRCIRFQLVVGCIKGQALPFFFQFFFNSFVMRVSSIVKLDFLDAHGGYYMTTVYIHYMFFHFLQLIHENFISDSSCALYIYARASFFLLISFYL